MDAIRRALAQGSAQPAEEERGISENASRARRAIAALREPDASLSRVPGTVRYAIAEVIEEQQALLGEALPRIPDWTTGVNDDLRSRIQQAIAEESSS